MGGKSSSSGTGAYDYYGSVAGIVCQGPVDYLVGVVMDGKDVWPGSAPWATGVAYVFNDLRQFGAKTWKCISGHTSSTLNQPPNGAYWVEYSLARGVTDYADVTVAGYGTMRIYWGTQTQTQDSILATAGNNLGEDHPAYKGICYVVFRDSLFGRERTSAPNVEVIVRKKNSQAIVTGASATLQDDQTSPVTNVLSAATDQLNGVGIASSLIDATSWQDAADGVDAVSAKTYVSTLLDQQTTLASYASDMSLASDMFVRFNASTKKMEAGFWKHGVTPGTYWTLGIDDIAEGNHPEFTAGGWKDAQTGAVVVFTDRERAYKQSSDKVDDLRAVAVVGENRRINLQRPYITRRDQALAHAAETLRTIGRPQLEGTLSVRREKARAIQVGDWVRFDIDIEPGGLQLLQFFRVSEKNIPYRGPIELKLDADETLTPIPYTPPVGVPGVLPTDVPPALSVFRFFTPTSVLAGQAGEWVCLLAQRPDPMVIGVKISFDSTYISPQWDHIGDLDTFGVYGTLHTAYADTATGNVSVDFPNQLDIARLSQTITPAQYDDDAVLLILLKKAATQISNDATGFAEIEVMSVSSIALTSGTTYSLAVNRARQGTVARTFPITGDGTEAWLVNRESLRFFTHAGIKVIADNATLDDPIVNYTAFFLLQPFSPFNILPETGMSAWGYDFQKARNGAPVINWISPDISPSGWNGKTHTYVAAPGSIDFEAAITDPESDLTKVSFIISQVGGTQTPLYTIDAGMVGVLNAKTSFNFSTAGQWAVTLIATDRWGNVTSDTLTAIVAPPAGKVATPYWKYKNGNKFPNKGTINWGKDYLNVICGCDTSGATIYVQVAYYLNGVGWGTPQAVTTGDTIGHLLPIVIAATGASPSGQMTYMQAKKFGSVDSDIVVLYWSDAAR